MAKITQKQLDKRGSPYNLGNKWFYLDTRDSKCSFHDGPNDAHVHNIPVKAILHALEDRGFLDQWDRKQQVLRKLERPK